jgi:radical SAM protein with 4Fe4S-binding SPASM domain
VAEEGRRRGCSLQASNNLGYYGKHDAMIRPAPWQGCAAGLWVMGIEADGSVKGCPSLPSAPYVGGNLRETPLRTLWEESVPLRFARERTIDELWGYCGRCYYAPVCKGGCSWTAHTLLGRRGNMPYCFHRAEMLQAEGVRERLVKVEDAPGIPFDFGRFTLIEEPLLPAGAPESG